MTTITDLQRLGPGQLVQGFEARVKKAWPAETKQGQYGTFVSQNVELLDSQGVEIRCRIMDPPTGRLNDGEVIRISAYQDDKKKWGGAVTSIYRDKLQLDVKGKAIQVLQASGGSPAGQGWAPAPSRENGSYPAALAMPGDPPEPPPSGRGAEGRWTVVKGPIPPHGSAPMHQQKAQAGSMTETEAVDFFVRNIERLLRDFGYLGIAVTASERLGAIEAPPPHVLELLGAWVTSMFIATRPSRDGVHVTVDQYHPSLSGGRDQ